MALRHNEPASGPNVATDAIAGDHYQKVKLFDGTAGGTTPVPVGANGLLADVSRIQAPVVGDSGSAGSSGSVLSVKQAFVDAATGADRIIVGSVSGKKIRVLSACLSFTAAATLTVKTGATTNINAMPFAANGQWMASSPRFLFETSAITQDLVFNVSAGSVKGVITYVEV